MNVQVIEIRLAWWFKYLYLPGLVFFCHFTGCEPDMDKVDWFFQKAISQREVV